MRKRSLVALLAVDAVTLVALRPDLAIFGDLEAPHQWLTTVGADAAAITLAAAALWLAAVWLGIGLLAIVVSALPGTLGRCAQRLAVVLLPRALYRVAAGAAGFGVLLSPAVAGAATSPAQHSIAQSVAQPPSQLAAALRSGGTPTPHWPSSEVVPAPNWPTTGTHSAAHPAERAPTHPAAHPTDRAPATGASAHSVRVTVQPGDSLWRIAEEHLPAHAAPRRIAAEWPRWYAANRHVIGADPDQIVTGQSLELPTQ